MRSRFAKASDLKLYKLPIRFNSSPIDLQVKISSYLTWGDLCEFSVVSKSFNNIFCRDITWKKLCIEFFSDDPFFKAYNERCAVGYKLIFRVLYNSALFDLREAQGGNCGEFSISLRSDYRFMQVAIGFKSSNFAYVEGGLNKTPSFVIILLDKHSKFSFKTFPQELFRNMQFLQMLMEHYSFRYASLDDRAKLIVDRKILTVPGYAYSAAKKSPRLFNKLPRKFRRNENFCLSLLAEIFDKGLFL